MHVVTWRREGPALVLFTVTALKWDWSHMSAAAALKWDEVVTRDFHGDPALKWTALKWDHDCCTSYCSTAAQQCVQHSALSQEAVGTLLDQDYHNTRKCNNRSFLHTHTKSVLTFVIHICNMQKKRKTSQQPSVRDKPPKRQPATP